MAPLGMGSSWTLPGGPSMPPCILLAKFMQLRALSMHLQGKKKASCHLCMDYSPGHPRPFLTLWLLWGKWVVRKSRLQVHLCICHLDTLPTGTT